MDVPSTLQEAIVYFSDPDRCFQYALNLRWPNGVVSCPRCGSEKHSFIKTRRVWFCSGCKKQFTLKVGTIFEDSPLGLDKWMCAFWMICNCQNGVSSCEIARTIGITQKSAWFMMHRIRKAMHEDVSDTLGGEVEVDETFIGGKARNMHVGKRQRRITGTGGSGKAVAFGLLERGGKVRTMHIPDRQKETVQPQIKRHVQAGAALYTDEMLGYRGLAGDYAHKVVNHAVEYVDGRVHTNGLENFWSLLKRGINGTYVSVEPFHLFRYLDEQSFRYNNRKDIGDQDRFEIGMKNVAGRRLTYKELTGKELPGVGAATSH
jgi:transposase-like protein